jgi:flagellar L-ring protein precursor FlgH
MVRRVPKSSPPIGSVAAPAAAVSLYDEANYRALTSDRRAQKPGDLLTVLVFETASASTSTDTSTTKSGGPGFALESSTTRNRTGKLSLTEDFNGRGRIQRSGKLAAQLTVTVRSVEPNGDLLVSGEQLLRVNNEHQEIVLSGRVRPSDIGENNTIASSRLADAEISYEGEGTLSEKSSPGIISRVLTWLGLL